MVNLFERIKGLVQTEFDAILITSPINRRYITGFPSTAGFVLITPEKTVFITDFRYYGSALDAQNNGKIDSEIEILLQDNKVWDTICRIFSYAENILVEESYLTLSEAQRFQDKLAEKNLVNGASEAISKLRAVKTENELSCIIKAQEITDKAFDYIVNWISDNIGKPDFTESRVALELEYFMRAACSEGVAFDTIAVSGIKSAMPHGVPENIPVASGFLTMDFGAKFGGYCADMTRTVCIGKPTEKMKHVYNAVLQAQLKALEYISAGKTGKEIDAVARNYIDASGYGGRFGHSLGHSLGLEVHENPNFSPSGISEIPAGAVISVEPGIYLDGEFGVRIEDIVNITENGCKNLTKSPKELIIL